jgi:hypothetical protein
MSEVSERSLVDDWQKYETALMQFQAHVKPAGDGTFRLDVADGKSIGVDPDLFEKFKRALEVTNEKIRKREIDPKEILYVNYADGPTIY